VLITDTLRTNARQAELYAKGRETKGPKVTNARPGQSFHNYGVAWDAVPWEFMVNDPDKLLVGHKLDWTPFKRRELEQRFRQHRDLKTLDRRWRVMAEKAAELNIEWAGMWESMTEYCHFQFTGGRSLDDFRQAVA
ncbi:unnamed protein product, partial [marine sediment metagenome]